MGFTVHFPRVHHNIMKVVATYKIGKVPTRHPVHPGSILRLDTQNFYQLALAAGVLWTVRK